MRITRIFLALLVLNGVIISHELGHFVVARYFGVSVPVISIGFGPAVARWNITSDVEIRIGSIPVGGYVALEIAGSHLIKHPWQSIAIFGSSIAVNLLSPILLLLLFSPKYRQKIGCAYDAYPQTLMRKDLIESRRFKFPFFGPFFMFRALASPCGENLAEEYAWKYNDLSRMVGFLNLIPLYIFDGGKLFWSGLAAIGALTPSGDIPLILYLLTIYLWVLALLSCMRMQPPYWRRLL